MTCDQHPWGLAEGLACTGTSTPHAHVFVASVGADLSDERAEES